VPHKPSHGAQIREARFVRLTRRLDEKWKTKKRSAALRAPIFVNDGLRANRQHAVRSLPAELDERGHVQKHGERHSEDRHQDKRVCVDQFIGRIKREHLKRRRRRQETGRDSDSEIKQAQSVS